MAEKKKVYRFPKALGACADRLYELKEARLVVQKQADAIEQEEKALKAHLIDTLPKSKAEGVSGTVANVKIVRKEVPQVKDYEAFYAHVKKTGSFDLLQRRLNDAAVKERLDAGKVIPGVEVFTAVSVSLTKV